MESFEAIPKNWGNSIGITIPKDIVKRAKINPKKKVKVLMIGTAMDDIKQEFGTLKLKKDTQKVMDELDETEL